MNTATLNRYRNPWFKSCNTPRPEYYENHAPMVHEYRGVQIFKLFHKAFDYVLGDCCITQRGAYSEAEKVIDGILDGETPVADTVAAHLSSLGFKPLTYAQYSADYAAGLRE